MKHINLISLTQAFDTLEKEEYESLLVYHDIEIKDAEVNDLKSLITILNDSEGIKSIFNQFYVGYKIPQIAKEFDLLRFGEDSIINVELKNNSTEKKILKQLKQNRYYLSFLNKQIYNYTFVEDIKKLYHLNDDTLEEVDIIDFAKLLYEQKVNNIDNIDKLFNPSDYLVSPFNSTEKFIENKYFLTQQQETAKRKIIDILGDNNKANFFAVIGGAGTGKTLLTYDIAKKIINDGKKVLLIHCGCLNNGHIKLNSIPNWNIIPVKSYRGYNLSDYNLIIIDEAQRMYPKQMDTIVEEILSNNGNCIFSYDKLQTLSTWEAQRNVEEKINNITSIVQYKLSEKIRTNKDVSSFIKMLFDNKKNKLELSKDNIEISYFNNDNDAKEFLEILSKQDWEVLRFTPSQYGSERHERSAVSTSETSHGIIGQEFDNVGVIIDQCFFYKEDGKLHYKCKSYYHPVKMLFQNITRTRKKVHVVIINSFL